MTDTHLTATTEQPAGASPGRPDGDALPAGPSAHAGPGARSPRLWSARRVPAAVVALVVFAAAGTLLYDVIAVRTGHRAGAWRTRLVEEMTTRPVDDPWLLATGVVAVLLGLWLLVLAVTPGLRRLLPLRVPQDSPELGAWLDRKSAALILRDAAMRVPGVNSARVRVGRRRIVARAEFGFRDIAAVRDDLSHALRKQCRELALAHTPRLTVRLHHHTR
ncbi:DUF6286 domain-containing protein [Streptomyces sp. NPDC096934]|uniref:DUF6286 domain-containing protein n=1 Tax=Streptomyces sp. NPDC096934 TaxID=3155551 RepID=UPI0033319211